MLPTPLKVFAAPTRPKVALVLGSGGLNSLAALPMIDFMDEQQIRPEVMVGCSGASITLALWASGFRGRDMGLLISKHLTPGLFPRNWRSLAIMLGLRRKGFDQSLSLFNTGRLFKLFKELYGDRRLEDLEVPLVLQATDFDTGEGVEQASGNLADAVYASCAAYPFLHPIQINGRLLFDGMYSAPLPILPAVSRGVDIIIAMDFSAKLRPRPASFFEAMIHVNKLLGRTLAQSQMLASLDLHHQEIIQIKVRPPAAGADPGADPYEWILAAGRRAVEEYGPEILTLMRDHPARTAILAKE